MKYVYITLILLTLSLIGFNLAYVDFSNPLEGDSIVAVISIISGFCALVLLAILYVSKKILQKGAEKESENN